MILALNTATPTCELFLWDGSNWHDHSWEAGRTLAGHLHQHIHDALQGHEKTYQDLQGICVFRRPGSFTGLRIGITVANTLAHELQQPIVGVSEADWKHEGLNRLEVGEYDSVVLPLYGSAPHITQPRK